MDSNLIDCELVERDTDPCGCRGEPTLSVLKDVQKAYEERMEAIDRMPACRRPQMQVEVLRSWVGDLVGQNSLLARAVEELETEATNQLFRERRRNSERERKPSCGTVSDLKVMNETLYKENIAKDREIRKLNKDVQQYEQTILSLRSEISIAKYHTPDVSKKDVEVMAVMCCTGPECGDWEPVKEFSAGLREELVSYQERIHKMEASLKTSGTDVRILRSANVTLRVELHRLRGECAALAQVCHSHAMRNQFKDDIIREMRRQLKQAKAQSKEVVEVLNGSVASQDRPSPRCVHTQPRRTAFSLSDDCRSPRLVLSGDDLMSVMPD